MCKSNCCCKNTSPRGLIQYLMVFIMITFVLSFISIFIRAGKTERYKQALIYLEERNNGTFNVNDSYINCRKGGYIFKDETYCEFNGVMLKKPDINVNYQSLFKKWKKIELIINVFRTVVTGIFCAYLFFIVNPKLNKYIELRKQKNNNEITNENSNFWIILIVCLSILITISSLEILIRAFAISANFNIGLYEETSQDQFSENIAINYILDIIIIVLTSICICFVHRLNSSLKQIKPEIIIIKEPSKPEIVLIKKEEYVNNVIISDNNLKHPMDAMSN